MALDFAKYAFCHVYWIDGRRATYRYDRIAFALNSCHFALLILWVIVQWQTSLRIGWLWLLVVSLAVSSIAALRLRAVVCRAESAGCQSPRSSTSSRMASLLESAAQELVHKADELDAPSGEPDEYADDAGARRRAAKVRFKADKLRRDAARVP